MWGPWVSLRNRHCCSANSPSSFCLRSCYTWRALTLTGSEQALLPGCGFLLPTVEAGCSGAEHCGPTGTWHGGDCGHTSTADSWSSRCLMESPKDGVCTAPCTHPTTFPHLFQLPQRYSNGAFTCSQAKICYPTCLGRQCSAEQR